MRDARGRTYYYVGWEGFPDQENTWVLHSDFREQEILAEYIAEKQYGEEMDILSDKHWDEQEVTDDDLTEED